MKALFTAGLALAAATFASAAGGINAKSSADTSVIAVAAIDAVAIVIKSDLALRKVTIKDPKGRDVTIDFPPEVPLDQIREGVLLDVRYVEAEALSIGKPGSPPAAVQMMMLSPQSGTHPSVTARSRRVTGRIRKIDRRRRVLTIVGSDNSPIELNVSPVVAGFEGIQVGDAAVIEYTGALALSAVKHEDDMADTTRM
jgi:hypothetical protein